MADSIKNLSPAKQVALKLRLENTLIPELRKVFAAIRKDFVNSIIIERGMPSNRLYLPAWQDLLLRHYKRVQTAFLKTVEYQKEEKQQFETEEEEKEKLLLLALDAWREQNINPTAAELVQTTRTNMSEAIEEAEQNFISEGKFPSNRELAAAAAFLLRKKFNGRLSGIAVMETQKASESTKLSKIEVEAGAGPTVLGGAAIPLIDVYKVWYTRLDDRVRPAHSKVHGQTQPINKPFRVFFNGREELLRIPGDMSLGASKGNVARCRCVTLYKTSKRKR